MLENYEKEQRISNFKETTKEKKPINQPLNKIPANNYQIDEQINNYCSFFTRGKQNNWIACNKPLFDRKESSVVPIIGKLEIDEIYF